MVAGVATEWKSHRLSSVVDQAQTGFASGEDVEDGLLQVRMNNITTDGAIDWTKKRRVPPPNSKKGAPFIKVGDVLFNHTNSPDLVGKSAYFSGFSEAVTYSNHFICLSPRENALDGKYLAKWLQKQWQGGCFRSMCKQWVNQATVGKDSLLNLEIPLPPLEEQKRIAAILDQADDIRRKRQHAIDRLNQLGQAIFHEMFGDITTNPMGWDTVKLGDVCGVGSSKRVFVEEFVELGVPFYRGTEVGKLATGEKIDPDLFISPEHYSDLTGHSGKPSVGDLLLPSICHDGRIWRVDTEEPFYFKDGRVLWIKQNESVLDGEYLRNHLRNAFLRNYNSIASGTTFAELKIVNLKGMSVLCPPLKMQRQFSERIRKTEDCGFRMVRSSVAADSLFASLQHRAFTGQL